MTDMALKQREGESASSDDFQQLRNATIMMVDDEPITMEVVQAFLEDAGYSKFVLIEDSSQAIQVMEEVRPDILLLDLVMPGVSGFEILEAVRTHPKLKHIPVIILTSSSDAENKLRALDLGATDLLAKPVDQSELKLRVRNTLTAKAYQDHLAYYDGLTNLPNRLLFMERFEWAIQTVKRFDEHLALISIELDQFDKINDTIGMTAGDEILRQVARRIEDTVRSVDLLGHFESEEDAIADLFHFDSSVFSLLLYRLHSEESAAQVADRVLKSIREAIHIEKREIYVTASMGIATYPSEDKDPSALLRLASSARDFAKNKGGNSFQFSSREINTLYERRISLESSLRKALDREEFILYYQPKVNVKTGAIEGVEALLRWNMSGEGIIPPDKFIPIAEETGLIIPIGEWVINTACTKLVEWSRAGKGPVNMAVNLSVKQFQDQKLPAVVEGILNRSGVDPKSITLEITESMLMENIMHKIEILTRLKNMGLKLAIDDFGTGYSSLNYLRKLPVDEIKIDRSFLFDLTEDTNSQAIVSSVIFLAHNLGMPTVAEGVETQEHLDFLKQEGCDQYQGFFFSRPLPEEEILEMLPLKKQVE